MTNPANFPERKRQRQLGALKRLSLISEKGKDNSSEFAALHAATAVNLRDVRTKKHLATASAARAARRKFGRS